MRRIRNITKTLFVVASTFAAASAAENPGLPPLQMDLPELSLAEFAELFESSKRWGEFGETDELGALNLITPQTRVAAAALVQNGASVSLSNPLSKTVAGNFIEPLGHQTFVFDLPPGFDGGETAAGDVFNINYHGGIHTHMDGVAHFGWRGKLYNGFDFNPKKDGFPHVGVEHIAQHGVFGRAVLVDLPRLYKVPYLAPGTAITAKHLEAWEQQTGTKVQSGDILLLRVGRWQLANENAAYDALEATAGLHASVAPWLRARGVAAIGCDAISDVMPSRVANVFNPVHTLANAALGIPIFDHLQLDEAAATAARLNRHTFLFTAAPLNIEGATGSPLTPLAIF
jgi:kynurenine formamidase